MTDEVKLSRLRGLLDTLEYPLSQDEAHDAVGEITLVYADGREPLADVVSRTHDDRFADAGDLQAEIYNVLPVEAVGEPGQSEGEG
jgi:hypothetical protein